MREHDFIAAAEAPVVDTWRLTGTADIEIGAAADGKPAPRPRVRLVAYTGVPMNVAGFYTPVIIELSGLRAPKANIPLLLDHDSALIVGQTDEITIADGQAVVSGIITGDDAPASKVVAHARNGFKWQASVGAQVVRREFVEAGKTVTVNGRTVSGPLVIAREAVLREVSLVAIGADADTSAAIAATHANGKDSAMTFEQWLQAKGFDPAKLSDPQKTALQAAWKAEANAAAQPPAAPQSLTTAAGQPPTPPAGSRDLDAVLAQARRDRERQDAITAAVEEALKANPTAMDRIEAIGRAAVRDGWSLEKARLELMLESRPTAPSAIIRGGAGQVTGEQVEAALLLSCGAPEANVVKSHTQQVVEQAAKRWRQGIGLLEVLQLAAKQRGYEHHGRDVQPLLQAAFSPVDLRAAAPSTLDIGGILSNVANKFLRLGFDAVEQAWREIAAIRSVRDFKSVASYSLTGDLTYAEIAPGGEIKHGTLGETAYSNQAKSYGRMLGIDRRDIINDDLNALSSVPMRLGRGAGLKLNLVFWAAFLDNASFFTSGRGNYTEGSTTNLSLSSLTDVELLFLNQTDPDKNPLGLTPKILLVPNALRTLAQQIYTELRVNETTTANKAAPASNPHAGKFRPVFSTYLSSTTLSGYSTTAWYLLADPNELPVIEVAFLNGQQAPTVEQAQADFSQLGIQMRGYHDFGVAKQEYRAGVKSKGAV
jgi:hypothetical protein